MQYRKLAADRIFDGYHTREGHVLVLSEDGRVEALVRASEAGEGVERVGGMLTPGFVNCHCHLELSHMKGKVPEKTGLVDFVFHVVTERGATEEEILNAIAAAEEEMRRSGIVAVGDICNNTLTLSQKQRPTLHYYNFIEASGWLPAVSAARMERAKGIYEAFASLQPAAIVPHAPYSVSADLWQAIQPYYQGKVVSIHNQETPFEDEFFLKGTGEVSRMYALMKIDNAHHRPTQKSSLQSYFDRLRGAEKIILVHNTFTRQEDIDFVNRQWPAGHSEEKQDAAGAIGAVPGSQPISSIIPPQVFFCLCVNANQYIEKALPPIELFRKNGCTVVLGTDSLASNWSLSILDEIKTIRKHFPDLSLEEMLRWATINGARALGMEKVLGSFEKGKKPGVLLIAEERLEVQRIFC